MNEWMMKTTKYGGKIVLCAYKYTVGKYQSRHQTLLLMVLPLCRQDSYTDMASPNPPGAALQTD